MGWLTCDHNYEMIDKTIMESAFEQLSKAGMPDLDFVPDTFMAKKLVILLKCKKCKKLKKVVEKNPE